MDIYAKKHGRVYVSVDFTDWAFPLAIFFETDPKEPKAMAIQFLFVEVWIDL